MKSRSNIKAFTLIETVLAIGIAAIITGSASIFFFNIVQSTANKTLEGELDYAMNFSISTMRNEMKKANEIDTLNSIFGNEPGKIVFTTGTAGESPVAITATDGRLIMEKGAAGATYDLIPKRVQLSSLTFQMDTTGNSPGLITGTLTIVSLYNKDLERTETFSINISIQ